MPVGWLAVAAGDLIISLERVLEFGVSSTGVSFASAVAAAASSVFFFFFLVFFSLLLQRGLVCWPRMRTRRRQRRRRQPCVSGTRTGQWLLTPAPPSERASPAQVALNELSRASERSSKRTESEGTKQTCPLVCIEGKFLFRFIWRSLSQAKSGEQRASERSRRRTAKKRELDEEENHLTA